MLVSISKAHQMTGVARSTIYKDLDDGTLSFELNNRKKKVIQVSELDRVYGVRANENTKPQSNSLSENVVSVVNSPENTNTLQTTKSDQVAVLQERIKALASTNEEKEKYITDLKEERNKARNLFETQITDMKEALSEAQKGYSQITKLLEDKSKEAPDNSVLDTINLLEKRIASQEEASSKASDIEERLKKYELAEEQRQQEAKSTEREKTLLKQNLAKIEKELNEEKDKGFFQKLFGK